jgi:uncharacterized protein YybS (DUF2232 family)
MLLARRFLYLFDSQIFSSDLLFVFLLVISFEVLIVTSLKEISDSDDEVIPASSELDVVEATKLAANDEFDDAIHILRSSVSEIFFLFKLE